MGFAWLGSLILFSWVSFKLGRKYQDFQDLMFARRIARLLKQREQVQTESKAWEEVMQEYVEEAPGIEGERKTMRRLVARRSKEK